MTTTDQENTMSESSTARDLGSEHHGRLVTIPRRDSEFQDTRQIILIGARQWTHEGVDRVGVTDAPEARSPWAGTEYFLFADDPVVIGHRIRKGVPRMRSKNYPAAAQEATR